MSPRTTPLPDDLSFGERFRVLILHGARDFVEQPGFGPERRVYLAGGVLGTLPTDLTQDPAWTQVFGRFVLIIHEPRAHRLSIHTDRYGLLPFFYGEEEGGLCFSRRLEHLVARGVVDNRMCFSALSDMLAFNVPLGEKTLVTGAHSMASGMTITIDLNDGVWRRVRSWEAASIFGRPAQPFSVLADTLFETFMAGVRASVEGCPRVGTTLSGGIDSRCLLAASLSLGHRPRTYNCSVPGSRSGRYADEMARMMDVPYHPHPVGADFAPQYLPRMAQVIQLTEGMTFSSEVECHWLREFTEESDRILHGAFGELSKIATMHEYLIDDTLRSAPRGALAETLWRRFRPRFEGHLDILAPHVQARVREQARENLRTRLEAFDPGLDTIQVLQCMYIEEYLAKVVKCSAQVWSERIPIAFPFSFPPYVDTLLQVRAEDRMTQNAQMMLLRRLSPALFRFPDANTGLRVDTPRALIRVSKVVDRGRRFLELSKAAHDHKDRAAWLEKSSQTLEEVLFHSEASELLNVARLRSLLDQMESAPSLLASPLTRVRQKLARAKAGVVIERALMVRYWVSHSGQEV